MMPETIFLKTVMILFSFLIAFLPLLSAGNEERRNFRRRVRQPKGGGRRTGKLLQIDLISDGGYANELGHCQGDCDYDTDCKDGLVCFIREQFQAVPGCAGGETQDSRSDFCVYDDDSGAGTTPTQSPIEEPPLDDPGIDIRPRRATEVNPPLGVHGLCVIGCTPYVNWDDELSGKQKYLALIDDIAKDCDIIVHVGDTKGGSEKCTSTSMTRAIHELRKAGESRGKLVLYAPGDNELNDCHRLASKHNNPQPGYIYKASDARSTLIDNLDLGDTDITGNYIVDSHNLHGLIPGTNDKYSCDFDKYVETDHFAVATLEVIGSHWYLDDERGNGYPHQDKIDPLESRLPMYTNAKDCALDWIGKSAAKAHASGLRAIFFTLHASFYELSGEKALSNAGLGGYFGGNNLQNSIGIRDPYQPLFDQFKKVGKNYPDLMIYVVHSDGHRSVTLRLFPSNTNYVQGKDNIITRGHQNVIAHQIEGASRGLTMYSKFTVDPNSFQAVTLKEEWSQAAFNKFPEGHAYKNF